MLIFPTKYADVFLIRRYTLVINYLQEAVYRRKEKYKLDILQSSIRVFESSYRANLRKHLPVCQVHFQILEPRHNKDQERSRLPSPDNSRSSGLFSVPFPHQELFPSRHQYCGHPYPKSNRTHKNHRYGQDVNGE